MTRKSGIKNYSEKDHGDCQEKMTSVEDIKREVIERIKEFTFY